MTKPGFPFVHILDRNVHARSVVLLSQRVQISLHYFQFQAKINYYRFSLNFYSLKCNFERPIFKNFGKKKERKLYARDARRWPEPENCAAPSSRNPEYPSKSTRRNWWWRISRDLRLLPPAKILNSESSRKQEKIRRERGIVSRFRFKKKKKRIRLTESSLFTPVVNRTLPGGVFSGMLVWWSLRINLTGNLPPNL